MNNTFCPIPWVNSTIGPYGLIQVCCQHNISSQKEQFDFDNKTAPRNTKRMKEVRSFLLQNKQHVLCNECWFKEKLGINSRRKSFLKHYDIYNQAKDLTWPDGTIVPTDFPLKFYHLRFSNECNLKCIMCFEGNSSRHGKIQEWLNSLDSAYLKELISNSNIIDRLYFTGGDPLINKIHDQLIELLVNMRVSKNIILSYNTNGLLLSKRLLYLWGRFKEVHVYLSIDGVGSIYEQIRNGAEWNKIREKILLFEKESASNTTGRFTITISKINIVNILDLLKWLYTSNFKKFSMRPFFRIVRKPRELSIKELSCTDLINIKKKYDNFFFWLKNKKPMLLNYHLRRLYKMIEEEINDRN